MLYDNDVLCVWGQFLGGRGEGFWGDAFKLMSESLEGTLAVLKIFFPQAVFETESFTGKSFGWDSKVLES